MSTIPDKSGKISKEIVLKGGRYPGKALDRIVKRFKKHGGTFTLSLVGNKHCDDRKISHELTNNLMIKW